MFAWLLNLPSAMRRRRVGVLAATAACLVLGVAGILIGRQLWALNHLHAAQRDIDRWRFADANAHLDRCLTVWPDDAETVFLAARTARRARLNDEAERHLEHYRELRGLTDQYNLERALLQVQQGDMETAEGYLRSTIGPDDPDAALVLEAMARGLLISGRFAALVECTDLWLKVRPDETHALYYRGLAFELVGDPKEATEAYRRSVDADPANIESQVRLGDLLLEHFNEPAEAQEHFARVLQDRPEHAEARLGLARCRRQLGDRNEARRLLDELLADNHDMAQALAERGKIALLDGVPERAEAWLRRAVELAPDDREALFTLIASLEEQKKEEEARVCRDKLAILEADLKRMDELTRQFAETPKNANCCAELAGMCLHYQRYDEARGWLARALQIDPNHEAANRLLSDYRQKSKHARTARAP